MKERFADKRFNYKVFTQSSLTHLQRMNELVRKDEGVGGQRGDFELNAFYSSKGILKAIMFKICQM